MSATSAQILTRKLRRIANEAAELPGLNLLAAPLYRRWFASPHKQANIYCGIFDSFEAAKAAAPPTRPNHYDVDDTARMYRDRFDSIRVSDYPLVHWISRLLQQGCRSLFDLGGHTGVSYYGFQRYIDYPADLKWVIHDTDAAIRAGRKIATELDPSGRLSFSERREDADGNDVLVSTGVLQYLDYTLADLLRGLTSPPPHVLVNLTPMHPQETFFTLQHIGIAICPYRVSSVKEFVASMEAVGYEVVDRWESYERQLRVPFAPQYAIDRYYGFYFRRRAAID